MEGVSACCYWRGASVQPAQGGVCSHCHWRGSGQVKPAKWRGVFSLLLVGGIQTATGGGGVQTGILGMGSLQQLTPDAPLQ